MLSENSFYMALILSDNSFPTALDATREIILNSTKYYKIL